MAKREITDNAAQTFQSIAGYVLANAPRGLTARGRAEAVIGMEPATDDDKYRMYLSLRFERGSEGCELRIELGRLTYERATCPVTGDVYREIRLSVECGTYSSGSSQPASFLVKAELMRDVAMFAAELQSAYAETYHQLLSTKAELEAAAHARKVQELEAALLATCENVMRGKRIGQWVDYTFSPEPALQPLFKGTFVLDTKTLPKRRFQVGVLEHAEHPFTATILRLDLEAAAAAS